jgi:hypothetical protein
VKTSSSRTASPASRVRIVCAVARRIAARAGADADAPRPRLRPALTRARQPDQREHLALVASLPLPVEEANGAKRAGDARTGREGNTYVGFAGAVREDERAPVEFHHDLLLAVDAGAGPRPADALAVVHQLRPVGKDGCLGRAVEVSARPHEQFGQATRIPKAATGGDLGLEERKQALGEGAVHGRSERVKVPPTARTYRSTRTNPRSGRRPGVVPGRQRLVDGRLPPLTV